MARVHVLSFDPAVCRGNYCVTHRSTDDRSSAFLLLPRPWAAAIDIDACYFRAKKPGSMLVQDVGGVGRRGFWNGGGVIAFTKREGSPRFSWLSGAVSGRGRRCRFRSPRTPLGQPTPGTTAQLSWAGPVPSRSELAQGA